MPGSARWLTLGPWQFGASTRVDLAPLVVVPAANTTSVAHCFLQDEGLAELQQASDLGDTQRALQLADQLSTLLNLQLDLIRDFVGVNGSQPFSELLASPLLGTTYMQQLVSESIPPECNSTLQEVLDTMIDQRCIIADAVHAAALLLNCDVVAAQQVTRPPGLSRCYAGLVTADL